MQDALKGRRDFERLNGIMNELVEANEAPGWLEENPNSIAAHILKLKDHNGKPLNRARLIQVQSLYRTSSHREGDDVEFIMKNIVSCMMSCRIAVQCAVWCACLMLM